MHILVTGSSGTIGTRLCEKLLAEGHTVKGVDRQRNKWQKEVDVHTIHADLREEGTLQKLPKFVDAIVHLAANARVYELVEDPVQACENFVTTFNVLEYARKSAIPHFIFASSRECYGNTEEEQTSEDRVRIESCESPYTASKLGGEALIHAYHRCYDLPFVILRFSNVYGMYDDSDRVIPLFIRRARKNEELTVFGKEKYLDFTYIDDAVEGILLALKKFEEVKGETFNIATGKAHTLMELAERIKEGTGSTSTIQTQLPRKGEIIRFVADTSKAKKLLGYEPRVDFEGGIKRSLAWYGGQKTDT